MSTPPQNLFNSLTNNAIDFLQQSIEELKSNPKYSVINFYASIELFLKARLLLEHWALIFDDPKKANFTKFHSGDFKSVNFSQSIMRLENIAKVNIGSLAFNSFDSIREHRNRLIHFFHPEYTKEANDEIIGAIVAEQCRGWLYLHRLLTRDWKVEFGQYSDEIENINKLMLRHRQFLQVKFDSVKDGLNRGKKRGVNYLDCPSCGFPARVIIGEPIYLGSHFPPFSKSSKDLVTTHCLVCEDHSKQLIVSCPECKNDVFIYDMGEGVCSQCKHEIDVNFLLDLIDTDRFSTPSRPSRAFCSECGFADQPTSVQFDDYGRRLCLYCLNEDDEAGYCEWCSEYVTGDLAGSYLTGCIFCEGRIGEGD